MATKIVNQEVEVTSVDANYQIAINYYKQKREMMNNLFRQDVGATFEAFADYINQKVQEFQSQVVDQVFAAANFENGRYTVSKSLPDMQYNYHAQKVLEQIANNPNGLMRRNISSFLGIEFEHFLKESFEAGPLTEAVSAFGAGIISNFLKGFESQHTGSQTSTSAVVMGSKNIRSDIVIMKKGEVFFKDDSGNLRTTSGGAVEFSEFINIDEFDTSEGITSREVLESYASKTFGFSMKLWKNENGKEFSSSSVLQQMLNATFASTRPNTWESQYTIEYVVQTLSKYLINIISPTSVAMITGRGFEWMDDFLQNKIFYMMVQMANHKKSKRGPGMEGHPSIEDSAIRIRTLGNNIHAFKARNNYRTGRITITNRKIS